jgi:protein-tyrosine phosphatase
MDHRFIDLPGVNNARDLGGYPAGGKRIRTAALLRSGKLCNAEPATLDLLSGKYRLKYIVDFRMAKGKDQAPDPDVEGAEIVKFPVVELEDYIAKAGKPELADQYLSGGGFKDPRVLFKIAYEYGMLSPDMYLLLLLGERGKKAYRDFLKLLIAHDPEQGAVLWHCEDGKDRAGLATMLILSSLGADRETIIEDYLLTNESNHARIAKTRAECEASGIPLDMTEAMIFANGGVFERYMTFALDTLGKKYGSVEGYVREELGVTDEELDILKEKYLE